MVDNANGVQVFSYDGRVLSNPRFPGLRVQFLNKKTLSLAADTVAIVGRSESKSSAGADSKGVLARSAIACRQFCCGARACDCDSAAPAPHR